MAKIGRPNTFTYEQICSICHKLAENGELPTVRKIRAELGGGSFSTLSSFLQRWTEERALAAKTHHEISDPLRQALLAEFVRVTESLQRDLAQQLANERLQLKEAQTLLAEQETVMEKLQAAFVDYQTTAATNQLTLEKSLAANEALREEGIKRERILQTQVDTLREQLRGAEVKIAVAVAEAAGKALEKDNQLLAKELQAFKTHYPKVRNKTAKT